MALAFDTTLNETIDDLRAYERMSYSDEDAAYKLTARLLFWNAGWIGDLTDTAHGRYGEDSIITVTLRSAEKAMRETAQETAHEIFMDCGERFCERCSKRRRFA